MTELAFISGQHNQAFCLGNNGWLLITETGQWPTSAARVDSEIDGYGEYKVLHNVNIPDIRNSLARDKQFYDALFSTLAVLDDDLSISTRVLVAQSAEEFLTDSTIRAFVLDRVLSRPLPSGYGVAWVGLMDIVANFEHLRTLLTEVFDSQTISNEVTEMWAQAISETVSDVQYANTLRSELTVDGFFARVIKALKKDDLNAANTEIVSTLLAEGASPSIRRATLFAFQAKVKSSHLKLSSRSSIKQYKDFPPESSYSFQAAKPGLRPISSFEAFNRVERQILGIRQAIDAGKLQAAEDYVRALLAFQLGRDEISHAVRSLCNVAVAAMDASLFDFAAMLIERAAELDPNDEITFSERAELLKRRGYFAASLAAYDDVIARFPLSAYTLCGKADVLHEMEKFDEAKSLYRAAIASFPEDPVAYSGLVGILKSQGRYREALTLARENLDKFPQNLVVLTVLAGCASSTGDYEQAITRYQEAMTLDRTSSKPIIGAAYAMRSSGRPDVAISFLNTHLASSKRDRAILMAKGNILLREGRFADARAVYGEVQSLWPIYLPGTLGLMAVDAVENRSVVNVAEMYDLDINSETDWIEFRTKMTALISADRASDAAVLIEKYSPRCQWLKQKIKLKTLLGLAQIYSQNDKALQTLQAGLEKTEDSEKQFRLILMSQVHLQTGQPEIAKTILSTILATKDHAVITLKRAMQPGSKAGANVIPFPSVALRQREISIALAA